MANVNTVSFGKGAANADLQAENAALERRQRMVDALRMQAMAPLQAQQGLAQAAKISPWEGVAKLGAAYFANKAQEKNDAKQKELGAAGAARMAEMLKSMAPAGTFDTPGQAAAPVQSGQPSGTGPMPDMPADEPSAPSAPPAARPSPALRQAWTRALSMYGQDPELGGKMIQNLTDLTGEQKDMEAQGIDPRLFGAARMAKMKADGLMPVAAGSTVYDPTTNKPLFAGPDFKSGMNNTINGNGVPEISQMKGAELIPQMAGQVKGAEAGAQAGFDMVEVNTPQGPRMMTRAQAVQMSGGGAPPQQPPQMPPQGQQMPPQAPQGPQGAPPQGMAPQGPPNKGFPPGTQVPAPTPGLPGPLPILQQEMASIMQRPDSDPRKASDLAAIQREIAKASGQPPPSQQPQMPPQQQGPGIALQTAAQKEAEIGAVRTQNAVEQARMLAAQAPEELAKIKDAGSTLDLINMAEPLLKASTGSGAGAIRDKVGNFVGVSTKSAQAAAQLAVIGASLTAKVPKMSGPTSDKDMALYIQAAGSIGDPNVPGPQKAAAMQIMRGINQKYAKDNQGSIADKAVNANRAGVGTPSADDLVRQYLKGGR